jgi:hypothetical protein
MMYMSTRVHKILEEAPDELVEDGKLKGSWDP